MNTTAEPVHLSIECLRDLLPAARAEAATSRRRVMEILEERSGLDAEGFVWDLGAALRYPVLRLPVLNRLAPAFDLLPYSDAVQRECVLLRRSDGGLLFAFANPFDETLRVWAEEKIRDAFSVGLVHYAELGAYFARLEQGMRAMDSVQSHAGAPLQAADAEDLTLSKITEDASPVVRLVNSTLYDALKAGASDIHLESAGAGMIIKYRIDGVLTRVGSVAGSDVAEQVISRIKVMSELDIAERRIPQDGRFKVSANGRDIDVRVSVMPSISGEDAVLRVLDKQQLADEAQGLRLESLGFDAETLAVLRRLAGEPYGMVLVTGPTGSGKTTTLYASVSEINHGGDKIVTIEDPVEYQLPGVLQIPVNEKKGLTFARGLRSILRHDPDKILVGEIRDGETAQIAVQAALTGHLVFTTVHANNVFDVIGRFLHMGLDAYSFVSAVNGIVAQRLVRLVCGACTEPARPAAELLSASGIRADEAAGYDFRSGKGCAACRGTGYRGRKAIAEYLILTDEVREMIVAREPIRRVKQAVRAHGTRFLREAALDAVRRGETDLKEINRVTFVV
jgi:general secretion pathway protein E